MLMTSSTATRGRGGRGGGGEWGGEGQDGMGGRRRVKDRYHRIPTRATDHSRGGGPPSRSPRLTVMGDLRKEGNRDLQLYTHQTHTHGLVTEIANTLHMTQQVM